MVHQASTHVSSFSGCLEFSSEFLQISVNPSIVTSLAVSEVHLLRKPMSLFSRSLGVDFSESVALHLSVAHNETLRQIAIYNDKY